MKQFGSSPAFLPFNYFVLCGKIKDFVLSYNKIMFLSKSKKRLAFIATRIEQSPFKALIRRAEWFSKERDSLYCLCIIMETFWSPKYFVFSLLTVKLILFGLLLFRLVKTTNQAFLSLVSNVKKISLFSPRNFNLIQVTVYSGWNQLEYLFRVVTYCTLLIIERWSITY